MYAVAGLKSIICGVLLRISDRGRNGRMFRDVENEIKPA